MAAPDPKLILDVIKFVYDLCQDCRAAPVEIRRAVGKLMALHLNLEFSQDSILERSKDEKIHSKLEKFLNECVIALEDVKTVLQKYPDDKMSVWQKWRWSQLDKADFDEALSYLEFLTTQLDKLLEKADSYLRAGKIELELDKTDDVAAVNNAIQTGAGFSPAQVQLSRGYAALLAGEREKRPKKKSSSFLECWTVLKVNAQGTTKFQGDKDTRGQWKLKEMAQDTKKSETSLVLKNDDRVQWILKSSREKEKDKSFEWRFVAARLQRCHETLIGVEVEEQVMVIIKRRDKQKAAKPVQQPTKNEGAVEKASEVQCKFWPNCPNKDCEYLHPALRPSCLYGLDCTTLGCKCTHPSTQISPCQNGKSCTKLNCKLAHTSRKLCRYFPACAKANCKYLHVARIACRNGIICDTPACKYTHPAFTRRCWNGAKCAVKRCLYLHDMVPCQFEKGCTSPTCTFGHP